MTYTPCAGTGQAATETRIIRTDTPRFRYLNGKVTGHCAACGKSVRIKSLSSPIAPAHKGI